MRIVLYVNQFFAGLGGEDHAGEPPAIRDGALGPGRRLQQLLGDAHQIVATVHCGDDYAATVPDAAAEILALAQGTGCEALVAGPAFTSGRYGLACARVAAAAVAAGIPAVASMHADNPGLDEAGVAPVVASGASAREMEPSLRTLAAAVEALARGETLGAEHGRVGALPRRNRLADRPAAERAVDLALARLGGDADATEIPLPRFDQVTPAAPVEHPSKALVALLTEGGLVPSGNPDGLESARATRWVRYRLEERDAMASGEWVSIHGGFSTVHANADPNRMLPIDVARELEREGAIGRLHGEYFATTGNGTSIASARRFGIEWAAELRRAGIQAAILTST